MENGQNIRMKENMAEERKKYSVNAGINGNLTAELKVSPKENSDGIAVVEHTLPAGKLAAPLHRHSHEDEISYILEGKMGVQEDETVSTVAAGEFAVKQRGVWHTFWNPGEKLLRFHEIITPGEFAWYFQESAELLSDGGEPNEETRKKLEELHTEYGFELDPDSVPELLDQHGIET